jgi:Zn finger protein HypA/HybF involved in hydrogenase expression
MFTKEQEETYLEHGGTKCPKCRSEWVEGDSWNVEYETATQECHCSACGANWYDVYDRVGIQERQ